MRRTGLLICCITLALVATSAQAGQALTPHRYLAGSDGPLVQVSNPHDGRTWAAWAYRNGSEFDIAISHVDADGNWTEPVFVGRDDRRDQVQPAIAADEFGNVYLAWSERATGRVMVSVLGVGQSVWTAPAPVSPAKGRAAAPALLIVGQNLVVAYHDRSGTHLSQLPLLGPAVTGNVNDGPDPVGSKPPPSDNDDGDDAEGELEGEQGQAFGLGQSNHRSRSND